MNKNDLATSSILLTSAFIFGAPVLYLCGGLVIGCGAIEVMAEALVAWEKEEALEQAKWAERIKAERDKPKPVIVKKGGA